MEGNLFTGSEDEDIDLFGQGWHYFFPPQYVFVPAAAQEFKIPT